MTTGKEVRPGFRCVTPYVIVNKAPEMVEFMKQAFGAEEMHRSIGSAGGFHIEVRLGDSMLMVGGGRQFKGEEMPTSFNYFVGDVDAVYAKAIAAGATSLRAPANQSYGVRDGSVKDLAGNHWYISTPWNDAKGSPIAGMGSVAVYLHPKGAYRMIDFLKKAFEAEEVEGFREPAGGAVVHAKIRVMGCIVEMGEAHGEWAPMPTAFFLYVEDPAKWMKRAEDAGAHVIFPMAEQPFGGGGGVKDPLGNTWYIFSHKS